MNNVPDPKELASQARQAIRQRDVVRLRALLEQGAPPDGWWDPVESAKRDRDLMKQVGAHTPASDQSSSTGGAGQEFGESSAHLWCLGEGPWPSEIPLHLAAEVGAVECLHALLAAGADINKRDRSDETALFSATTPEAMRALIDAGIDLAAVSRFGMDAFQKILAEATEPDDNPAHIESDLALCRAMLDAGVPLLFQGQRKSRLYEAASAQHLHGVRFLLKAGHPIDADFGQTALHAICWHSEYGEPRDANTRAIIRTLLEAGFDPNVVDDHGNTPLHEALSGDDTNLVAAEELLAAGVDVNAMNRVGQTPLHLSYETLFDYGHVVPFMLKHGANPLLRDKWGQTVIDIANRMIAGENPQWRIEMCASQGGPPCGWKRPATPGDAEYTALALLRDAAKRFGT